MTEYKKKLFLSILLFLSVFIVSLFKIYESDAFWHLKAGEYIVSNLTIPSTDPFTLNGETKQWVNTYWLFEVIIYLVYKFTGFSGLILFKAIISSAIFVVVFNALLLSGAGVTITFLIVAFFMTVFRERLLIRPDIISYLFISVYFYIFFMYKFKQYNKLYLLPLIMLFWTNMHSGALFGIILLFTIITGELLSESFRSLKNGSALKNVFLQYKDLILYSTMCLFVYFISPAHLNSIKYLFSQWSVREVVDISEFKPLFESGHKLLEIITAGLITIILSSFRRVPLSLLLTGAVFVIPGIGARRMVYYALLVNIPVIVLFFHSLTQKIKIIKIPELLRIIVCTLYSGLLIYIILLNDPYHYFGTGIRKVYFPVGHVNFLKRNKLKVNLYNTLNIGGGIIFAGFPDIKAFVDTRIQVNENTLKEIKTVTQNPVLFRQFLDKYSINALLIENMAGLIANNFVNTEEWGLVYWDDYSMLLLKKSEFADFVREHEIKIINPETIVLDLPGYLTNPALAERVIFHLKRSIAVNPDCYTAYYSLAYLLRRKEDKNLREISTYLDKAYRIEPKFIPTLYEIANLYASVRDFYNALYFYRQILDLERFYNLAAMYPTIYKEIGMVYLNLGNRAKARKYLKKSLRVRPFDDFVTEQLRNL